MIKVFGLLAVRPGLTVEAFHHHWSTVHREHALRIERIRRYVQAHRVRPGLRGLPEAEWEGVPEVWFDSIDSAMAQRTDPQYTEFARLDEPNFIDMENLRRVTAAYHVVRDPGEVGAKLMVFAHWPAVSSAPGNRHPGPPFMDSIGGALLDVAPDLSGLAISTAFHVDDLPRLSDGSAPAASPFDVVVEIWSPKVEAVRAGWDNRGGAILAALHAHLDLTRARGFLCEELPVVDRCEPVR
jgi:hypothetical protein